MTTDYYRQYMTNPKFLSVRLLFMSYYRGSIWDKQWPLVFLIFLLHCYLNYMYRFICTQRQQNIFEVVVIYCNARLHNLDVLFVVGFLAKITLDRFYYQISIIPWTHDISSLVAANVLGKSKRSQWMRNSIVRHINLSFVLAMGTISNWFRKTCPDFETMADSNLMTEPELEIMELANEEYPHLPKYFIPIVWSLRTIMKGRKEGRVTNDFTLVELIDGILDYEEKCYNCIYYNWVKTPFIYYQICSYCMFVYITIGIFGKQSLTFPLHSSTYIDKFTNDTFFRNSDDIYIHHEGPVYIPLIYFFELFVFLGWLQMLNSVKRPFEMDNEDGIEITRLIKTNIAESKEALLIGAETVKKKGRGAKLGMEDFITACLPDPYAWNKFPISLPYDDVNAKRVQPDPICPFKYMRSKVKIRTNFTSKTLPERKLRDD